MSDPFLKGAMATFAKVITEINAATLDMMRIDPVIALLVVNLEANLGYALTVPDPDPADPTDFFQFRDKKFETRQELVAQVFRNTAMHSGAMLDADKISDVFGGIRIGKIFDLMNIRPGAS